MPTIQATFEEVLRATPKDERARALATAALSIFGSLDAALASVEADELNVTSAEEPL